MCIYIYARMRVYIYLCAHVSTYIQNNYIYIYIYIYIYNPYTVICILWHLLWTRCKLHSVFIAHYMRKENKVILTIYERPKQTQSLYYS